MKVRPWVVSVVAAAALTTAGCSASDPGSSTAASDSLSASASASSSPTTPTVQGVFDAGDTRLQMNCAGSGTPTVVYFHGYIPESGGLSNAGRIPSLLTDDYRVCAYNRMNVGGSDSGEGLTTADVSARQARAMLASAEVEPPYLLLGASWGGLIASIFAAQNPSEIAGIVYLDPSLAGEEALDAYLAEPWIAEPSPPNHTEQFDFRTSYAQAGAVLGAQPEVPAVLLPPEDADLPPEIEPYAQTFVQLQETLMSAYAPGEIVRVDAPHFMEPEIPEEIADTVRRVAEAS